jgi:hypothetical protein
MMHDQTKETVIIVHGTFAAPKEGKFQWYQPSDSALPDSFVARLNAALQKRGSAARCWAHCPKLEKHFFWSGKNSWVDRTAGATKLVDEVTKLQKDGWRCHIIAHSHGRNVVLEALPQITAAVPSNSASGKIVTLGTPFMDTMLPILSRMKRRSTIVTEFSWFALLFFCSPWVTLMLLGMLAEAEILPPITESDLNKNWLSYGIAAVFIALICYVVSLLWRFKFFKPPTTQLPEATNDQSQFLAVGSAVDEPWQLLHHMQCASSPIAIQAGLVGYLASSVGSNVRRATQISEIYGSKSYRHLDKQAAFVLACIHLLLRLRLCTLDLGANLGTNMNPNRISSVTSKTY